MFVTSKNDYELNNNDSNEKKRKRKEGYKTKKSAKRKTNLKRMA